jgi:hypothetical protein
VTGPGDAIYIPNRWHHATLNVQDSVGVFFNHISAVETEERAREGGGARRDRRVVPPLEFHWGVAPRDVLDEGAAFRLRLEGRAGAGAGRPGERCDAKAADDKAGDKARLVCSRPYGGCMPVLTAPVSRSSPGGRRGGGLRRARAGDRDRAARRLRLVRCRAGAAAGEAGAVVRSPSCDYRHNHRHVIAAMSCDPRHTITAMPSPSHHPCHEITAMRPPLYDHRHTIVSPPHHTCHHDRATVRRGAPPPPLL